MPVTFAEDATGEEAKADVTRVTPDEKDGSARCETVKNVATELTKPSEKYHRRDSALALTLAYPFQEAFADKAHFFKVREVDREQGICQIKPQYQIVEVFNLPILFFFGLMARLLALGLLRFTALHKRGEVPLRSRIIGCFCCCRGRNRDTPLARWASTPSFLTGSLSTTNTPSTPRSPTEVTTEQPRATNFDSVPSIPSDLF